jgi:uncharacterized protein (TIGR03000 family)
MNLRRLMIGAVVAMTAVTLNTPRAQAFWWGGSSGGSSGGSYGSSGGSYGSSGGSYGSSGGSYGSSGGSYGSSGGFAAWRASRISARAYRRSVRWSSYYSSGGSYGSYGSSGGSYGSYGSNGSSGGSYGSYGSSGGSYGSHGSSGGSHGSSSGVIIQESDHPMSTEEGSEGATPDAADGDMTRYRPAADAILLSVAVPQDARVYVNNMLTKSTGRVRRYVSRGLDKDASFTYTIRAELDRDGETVTEEENVTVTAGEIAMVDLRLDGETAKTETTSKPVLTTLTLNVPEEAKVFLADKETQSKGPQRQFTTSRLSTENEWADYPVRVELTRDGKTEVREMQVSLKAGDTREITIDFDAPQLAKAGK